MPTQKPTAVTLDQVEIFKAGPRRAMNGRVYVITPAEMEACAAAYDPKLHEAPHVIGHPKTDDPAWGWVSGLQADAAGSLMVTSSRKVQPAFSEMVGSGQFPKRSACFYHPTDPSNPTPGTWYLKHVGWLGAQPPAVKGLADPINYGEHSAELVEFGEWQDEVNASLWRRLREWLVEQFGIETADKVAPSYELDTLQREALRPDLPPVTAHQPAIHYSEGSPTVTPEELQARQAELDAREATLREQEAAQATMLKSARSAGIAAFAEGMVKEGRWLPGERGRWVAFMESLPAEVQVVEFAEGSQTETVNTPALKVFQDAMKALPPRVQFAELAGREAAVVAVDMNSAASINAAAVEFQEAEAKDKREVSFEQAVQHIVNINKEAAQ